MKPQTLVVALLLGCVAFAGCAGAATTKTTPTPSQAPPATAGLDTGGIDGLVVDDEQTPVVGANVSLRAVAGEFKADTKSAGDGSYSFSNLDGGSYEIAIAAFGFESRSTKIEVVPGEVAKATTALVRIVIQEAIPELLIKKGFINCSVSHASHEGFYSLNPCRNQGNEASQIPWVIDSKRNASEAVVELVWRAGAGGSGERLQLWLCSNKDDTTNYMNCIQFVGPNPYAVRTHGKSPIVMRQTNLPFKTVSEYEVDVGDGWMETASPRVPVTFQQSFDLYLTACFLKPCGPDYQARPPG